jgi:UPF0271 protein
VRNWIDLNSDAGEAFGPYPAPGQPWRSALDWQGGGLTPAYGFDAGAGATALSLVSSVNLACGSHAGDPLVIKRFAAAAAAREVAVGAHPSYPDLQGFGLREMAMAPAELAATIQFQVAAMDGFVRLSGTRMQHVKFHGALYHKANHDPDTARTCAAAVAEYDRALIMFALPGSVLERACLEAGLPVAREAYIDRAYHADGRLVPRSRADAMVTDSAEAARRAVQMVRDGVVESVEGRLVEVFPDTLSLHSDTPNAVAMMAAVRVAFAEAGITVRKLA